MSKRHLLTPRTRARHVMLFAAGALTCSFGAFSVVGASSAGATTMTTTVPEVATNALLKLSDMPSGWTSTKSSNDNSSTPVVDKALAACTGLPVSDFSDTPPTANSPTFSSKDQIFSIDDDVEVFPTVKAAQADFASATNAKTPGCFTKIANGVGRSALTSGFPKGAKIGTITVSRANSSLFAAHGANLVTQFAMTVSGQTLNLQIIEVGYVKGVYEQNITFDSVNETFSPAFMKQITTTAAKRLP